MAFILFFCPVRPAEAAECVSCWIGQGANTFYQSALCQAHPESVSSSSTAADSTLDGKLFLSALRGRGRLDGGLVAVKAGGRGGAYCRFRSYSCGSTVIISPLLLNSVILSYISRARGQEILQFINRSTLCKGDYCMAYTLTSLFKDFFLWGFAVLPRCCLCSSEPDWVLSRGSLTYGLLAHTSGDLLCVCITPNLLCVWLFPWRKGRAEIKFPVGYDRGLCGWSQTELVSRYQNLHGVPS